MTIYQLYKNPNPFTVFTSLVVKNISYFYALVFSLGIFFYLWLVIDPSLYNIAQEPQFSLTPTFLLEHLQYPGGFTDYIASYLSLGNFNSALGSSTIAIFLFFISIATLAIMRIFGAKKDYYLLHLIPATICLVLQSNYYHSFAITIAFAATLVAFILYARFSTNKYYIRLSVFLILATGIYFTSGGALLPFTVLCILYEIFTVRSFFLPIAYACVSVILPLVAYEYVFLVSLKNAYFYLLTFNCSGYRLHYLANALYTFPAIFVFLPYLETKFDKVPFLTNKLFRITSVIIVGSIAFLIIRFSYNKLDHTSLKFALLVKRQEWTKILSSCNKSCPKNRIAQFAIAKALYNNGLLPVEMFKYPNTFGSHNLFLFKNIGEDFYEEDAYWLLFRCELFVELGLVNEAEQWGYEYLSMYGETSSALRMLANIHIVKGEIAAATICLRQLETMPGNSVLAKTALKQLEDSTYIDQHHDLALLQSSIPTIDFIRNCVSDPGEDLKVASLQHPINRMTYEYCMATYMLLGDVPKIASLIDNYSNFMYSSIPALYQQTLLMMNAIHFSPLPIAATNISQQTINDYNRLNGIFNDYHADLGAARRDIYTSFGSSFWYYYFYTMREKPKQNR